MKLKLLTALLFIMSVYAKAQENTPIQGCDFLKNLTFKNGVDTIFLLAYKTANVRLAPDSILTQLDKEKKLNANHFTYAISFIPLDCDKVYTEACYDTSPIAFTFVSKTTAVRLKCIVFEGYTEFLHPYFVIDKIMVKN